MADQVAGKPIRFQRLHRLFLYMFPTVFSQLVMEGRRGWDAWFMGAFAFACGFAVVRGIEAALPPFHGSFTPIYDRILLDEIRQRSGGETQQRTEADPPRRELP